MTDRRPHPPSPRSRVWKSAEEIEHAIAVFRRRRGDITKVIVSGHTISPSAEEKMALSSLTQSIRDLFGEHSPEFREFGDQDIYHGDLYPGIGPREIEQGKNRGKEFIITVVNGLIKRLEEKKDEFEAGAAPPGTALQFARLDLHRRIADVASERFEDGHCWDAVFAASKALVNMVKEKSGRDDLDGTALMRTVFSKNNPTLVFNDLADATKQDEQEGIMHLFEGAMLAIRNPGGHSFPEGTTRRAAEYLSLLSMLAHLVDESNKRVPI